jgi:predicted transcriptional regulator
VTRIHSDLSREETAALVCDALDRAGIPVVLSGGAVVSIYSENEYESFDLDFIRTGLERKVDGVMAGLGFEKKGRHWTHPDSQYWVEFPPGPVQVGEIVVTEFAERRTPVGTLRLLMPTECVMDRLAGFYHWSDHQCLGQAIAVARRHPIDLDRIKEWSRGEAAAEKFELFLERLNAPRSR